MVGEQVEYLPNAASLAVPAIFVRSLPAVFVQPLPVSVAAFPLATDVFPLVPPVISPGGVLSPPDAALLALSSPLDASHESLAPDALILLDVCEVPVVELHVLLASYVVLVQSSPAQSWNVMKMDWSGFELVDFGLNYEEHFDYG
jgi:hypothetical protein